MTIRYPLPLLIVISGSLLLHSAEQPKPAYPQTKTEATADLIHGAKVADPYRWLENGDSPEVKEWTRKQNAFTKSILDNLPGREKVHEQLDKFLDVDAVAGGVPRKGRIF